MNRSRVMPWMLGGTLLVACSSMSACNRSNDSESLPADFIQFSDAMPTSKFDSLLIGKNRRDVTSSFYLQLTFLPKDLKFFAVYKPGILTGSDFAYTPPSTFFFVVLPNNRVEPFVEAEDLLRIGLRLRSKEDALAFVRFLSGYGEFGLFLGGTPYFHLKFEGNELDEVAMCEGCSAFTPESLEAAGIKRPVVDEVDSAGKEKYFVVTRYMIPVPSRAFEQDFDIPRVIKVTERVTLNGGYSMTGESVPTPGFRFKVPMTL